MLRGSEGNFQEVVFPCVSCHICSYYPVSATLVLLDGRSGGFGRCCRMGLGESLQCILYMVDMAATVHQSWGNWKFVVGVSIKLCPGWCRDCWVLFEPHSCRQVESIRSHSWLVPCRRWTDFAESGSGLFASGSSKLTCCRHIYTERPVQFLVNGNGQCMLIGGIQQWYCLWISKRTVSILSCLDVPVLVFQSQW